MPRPVSAATTRSRAASGSSAPSRAAAAASSSWTSAATARWSLSSLSTTGSSSGSTRRIDREDRAVLEPVVGLDEAAVAQAAEPQLPEDARRLQRADPLTDLLRARRRPPRPRRAGSRGRDRAGSSSARRAARRRAGCRARAGLWRAVPQPPATPRSRLSPWSVRIRTDTAGRSRVADVDRLLRERSAATSPGACR